MSDKKRTDAELLTINDTNELGYLELSRLDVLVRIEANRSHHQQSEIYEKRAEGAAEHNRVARDHMERGESRAKAARERKLKWKEYLRDTIRHNQAQRAEMIGLLRRLVAEASGEGGWR